MSRPLRIQFPGAWYHVMNRGARRGKIFFTNKDKEYFLNLLEEATKVYGIEVHVYCLMGNHYHLVIHTPLGKISEPMRHINSCYAQYINRTTKRDGALFRGRYKAIIVSQEEYLLRLSRYVHLNPLKAKLVSQLSDYKWSSYGAYLHSKHAPKWLYTQEILKRFHSRKFKGSYKHFVETERDIELENFYAKTKFKPVLGGEDFCEQIFNHLKKQTLSSEVVGKKDILKRPDIEKIIALVAKHYQIKPEDIIHSARKKKNPARRVAILLCRESAGYTLQTIAEKMGCVTYAAISNTLCRAKKDKSILSDLKKLKKQLLLPNCVK